MLLRKLVVVGLVGFVSFAANIATAEDAGAPNSSFVGVDNANFVDPSAAFANRFDLGFNEAAQITCGLHHVGDGLFARPILRMKARVDDQAHGAPELPAQIADAAGGVALMEALFVGELFGVERPAFAIGVERGEAAQQWRVGEFLR